MRKVLVVVLGALLILLGCSTDAPSQPAELPEYAVGARPEATDSEPTPVPTAHSSPAEQEPEAKPVVTPHLTAEPTTPPEFATPPVSSPAPDPTPPAVSVPTPTVNESPVAVIHSIEPNPAYQHDEVTFVGGASDPNTEIAVYKWSIEGHGPIGYKADFVSPAAANEVGEYTVLFQVQDTNGVWSSEASQVFRVLYRLPQAQFRGDVTSGDLPLAVRFADLSRHSTSWEWDFGDGHTSTLQHPTHTYADIGLYAVSLTVHGPGGSDTEIKAGYIEVLDVDFEASVTSGYKPLTVQFADQSRENISIWKWTFGDGEMSDIQNPSHTYTETGTYTVSLMAARAAGGSGTETKVDYIRVLEPPPTAAFYCHSDTHVGLCERFFDRSEGEIVSWSWNFGDGNTSDERSPYHKYELPGSYIVSLAVQGPGGTHTAQRTILVKEWDPDSTPIDELCPP